MHHIYHDFPVKASKAKIFAAISQPDQLIKWWPLKCSGTPKIGESYNFYFAPEYDWHAEVTKCKPNESFHVKMTAADPDWLPTSFGFELEDSTNGSVNLRFQHKDWPACNAHFRRSSFCWAILLQGLKDYVEKGKVIPFKERS